MRRGWFARHGLHEELLSELQDLFAIFTGISLAVSNGLRVDRLLERGGGNGLVKLHVGPLLSRKVHEKDVPINVFLQIDRRDGKIPREFRRALLRNLV